MFAGQTVGDICRHIHKDFAENLRFARLWRGSDNPLTVYRDEVVRDRDVLELHLLRRESDQRRTGSPYPLAARCVRLRNVVS